jgi:predicted transcriptional regulator of viral defense system
MLKRGEIVRIRRGLYARSRLYGGTVEPMEIANLVYGPSYISLEYALSYYGMIPERVEVITSVTPKRSKIFSTPLGKLTYEHVPVKPFAAGIALEERNGINILIATREKALCDRIARAVNIRTIGEIEAYIFEDLRIDEGTISNLSTNLLDAITAVYGLQRISLFALWYRKKFRKER